MSTDIQRRKEQAEVEKLAKKAHEVEAQIKRGIVAINRAWVLLAAYLHQFHKEQLWQVLQYESLEAFLGSPDVGMKRSKFFALVDMHEYLVETHGVESGRLDNIGWSKFPVVLPAVKSGKVALDKALDDAEAMSRSDLQSEYQGKPEATDRRPCPTCGTNVDPSKLAQAA